MIFGIEIIQIILKGMLRKLNEAYGYRSVNQFVLSKSWPGISVPLSAEGDAMIYGRQCREAT